MPAVDGHSGIGGLSATPLVAAADDAKEFRDGREMAAWLSLGPVARRSELVDAMSERDLFRAARGVGFSCRLSVRVSYRTSPFPAAAGSPLSLTLEMGASD